MKASSPIVLTLAWLLVGAPLVYGIVQTLIKVAALFH